MRHRRLPLLFSMALLAVLAVMPFPTNALAIGGTCGGTVLCECGDTVLSDKQLSAADPVTSGACTGTGLTVTSGTLLDFNGHTIRGAGSGIGVALDFSSSSIEIRGGTISGFETGIRGFESRNSHISGLRLLDNLSAGLDICCDSTNNLIENLLIEGGGLAVRIDGSRNTLRLMTIRDTEGIVAAGGFPDFEGDLRPGNVLLSNRIADSRGDGLVVDGFRNTVARNVVINSAGDGIVFRNPFFGSSADNTVNNNLVSSSGGHGFNFQGSAQTVFRNITKNNAGEGLFVGATASTFDRNQSLSNGGHGIEDITAGDGTAGTANTYTLNIC